MGAFVVEDDPAVEKTPPVSEVGKGDDQSLGEASRKENTLKANKKKRKTIFQYGNYNQYYGYRVGSALGTDPRMHLMQKTWFDNKDVIDIGCNEGVFTISLVQKYRVRSMCGIDIDPGLINKASKNLEQAAGNTGGRTVNSIYVWDDYVCENELDYDDKDARKFSVSDVIPESTASDNVVDGLQGKELLERVIFKHANILHCNLRSNVVDTVLCLSVVKWIHLNWGDEGLVEFFIQTYRALRPGGAFILEPQPWSSYLRNFRVSEVGFKFCEEISLEVPNSTQGFSRPLYLFTK
uniref:RNA methyltransferase n=1 Tax=Physcomitrium patens TaxID=3218 RepID=A0A7I4B8P9_PHYPA